MTISDQEIIDRINAPLPKVNGKYFRTKNMRDKVTKRRKTTDTALWSFASKKPK